MIITSGTETVYSIHGLTEDDARLIMLGLNRLASDVSFGQRDRDQASRMATQIHGARNE